MIVASIRLFKEKFVTLFAVDQASGVEMSVA